MPASIVTDFLCIAQAGPTIDGRDIRPEWLTDMAQSYDPAVYTAKLWLDHFRYRGAYGSVRELKTQKDGDAVKLYARISPNRDLIELNQVWEQKLHFSIEPVEDFAKTGTTYLGGLGLTDEPASLGTDELRFSSTRDRMFTACYPGSEVPDLRKYSTPEMDQKTAQSIFNFFKQLFQTNKTETDNQQGEEPMDQEQFDKLNGGIESLNQAITGMMEKFSAGTPPAGGGGGQNGGAKDNDDTPSSVDAAQFNELKTGLEDLAKQFGDITERIEKAVPGTNFGVTTSPADGDQAGLL